MRERFRDDPGARDEFTIYIRVDTRTATRRTRR